MSLFLRLLRYGAHFYVLFNTTLIHKKKTRLTTNNLSAHANNLLDNYEVKVS